MSLDIKRRTLKAQQEAQERLKKEDESTGAVKKRTAQDDWDESAHSVTVNARLDRRNRVKEYDAFLYSQEDAKNLAEYARFSKNNPRAQTPGKEGNGGATGLDYDARQNQMNNSSGNGTTVHKGELAEGYRHVHLKGTRDDFDRDFRKVGRGGDFSQVRYKLPEENVMEKAVRGPAAGREQYRRDAESRINKLAKQQSESDKEKKERVAMEKKDEKKARNKKMREDWRTNKLEGTRSDTDFIKEIQKIGIGEAIRNPKQKAIEAMRAGPAMYPDHIGPKTRVINYEEVDKASYDAMLALGATVSDQLEGRIVEEAVWDEDTKPMSENRYFGGVQDDQLKNYRELKRQERLQQTMKDFSSRAADLVSKRNELIAQGYTMPGETIGSMTHKLGGVLMRKNLWKMAIRMIARRKAANVKWWKDRWHGRHKRKLSKAELEMIMQESEALFDAADQGNKKLVNVAIRYFGDVEHPRNGRTPFQTIFVRLCWIDAGLEIEPTWQPGYKVNDRADYEGVMRQLLDNGADINKIEMENTDGWAVVHHAAYLGCYKRVKYFLENGGTVDLKTRDGVTALMKACEGGHLDVIMLLVYTNHDIKARSDTNLTLLHYAALSGNLNVIKFLLEAGADKMATDDDGRTALDICNARDYRVCAETLSKFAHPKPTMKPLIEYWKEVQENERPESPSLFGHLGGSRASSRASSRGTWREMRQGAGRGWVGEDDEETTGNRRQGGIARSLTSFASSAASSVANAPRQARKSRFEKKVTGLALSTFGKKGSKEQQKRERNERKMREKEEAERIARGLEPEVSALGYLEGLLAEIPIPVLKPRAKLPVPALDLPAADEAAGEGGGAGGSEPEGKREFEDVLAEAEQDGDVVALQDAPPARAGKAGGKGVLSFFSPISKKSAPTFGGGGGAGAGVRQSIKMELLEKLGNLSPFKRSKQKAAAAAPPPTLDVGGEEVGGEGEWPGEVGGTPVKLDAGGAGDAGGGEEEKLPVILSPQQQLEERQGMMEAELFERKKEKKKKKKKKKRGAGGGGEEAELVEIDQAVNN